MKIAVLSQFISVSREPRELELMNYLTIEKDEAVLNEIFKLPVGVLQD
jgi:hypothetical protein